MSLTSAKILKNENIKGDFFLLILDAPEIAKAALPGQFVNVLVSKNTDPLLRRPFSIYGADPKTGELSVIYFVKGKGTAILRDLKVGDTVSVTGPHGNSFPADGKNVLLVGGGFGVAPLTFFARKYTDKNVHTVVGGRTEAAILCHDELTKVCKEVFVNTNDGTMGKAGFVTVGLTEALEKYPIDSIITVGPIPMMKAVALIAEKAKVPCYVSMEERMACGVGACFGCAVKTKNGMKRVCADGPIFSSEDIEW